MRKQIKIRYAAPFVALFSPSIPKYTVAILIAGAQAIIAGLFDSVSGTAGEIYELPIFDVVRTDPLLWAMVVVLVLSDMITGFTSNVVRGDEDFDRLIFRQTFVKIIEYGATVATGAAIDAALFGGVPVFARVFGGLVAFTEGDSIGKNVYGDEFDLTNIIRQVVKDRKLPRP